MSQTFKHHHHPIPPPQPIARRPCTIPRIPNPPRSHRPSPYYPTSPDPQGELSRDGTLSLDKLSVILKNLGAVKATKAHLEDLGVGAFTGVALALEMVSSPGLGWLHMPDEVSTFSLPASPCLSLPLPTILSLCPPLLPTSMPMCRA